MDIKLKLRANPGTIEIKTDKPVTCEEIAQKYKEQLPYTVIIARVNGIDRELTYVIEQDSELELLDIRERSADLAYQRSLSLMYLKAVKDVLGDIQVKIDNSLNKGLYTELKRKEPVTEDDIRAVEDRMREMSEQNIPIVCETMTREEAIKIWEEQGSREKADLLKGAEDVTEAKFYSIDGYRNYFFGLMAPSTGYLKHFELRKYRRGALLRFPYPLKPDELMPYVDDRKLYMAFGDASKWQQLLGISYLEDLNGRIKAGDTKELILLSEALHEKRIAGIADEITAKKKRIILIAGPSSSGKTTFAKRLTIQLKVNGLEPLYIGTDDYFVERSCTPLGEDGLPNYEDLDAIDIELFNSNMNSLLSGQKTDLPEFDFIKGEKRYGRRITSIDKNQPIVIEGLHALNEKLTEFIDDDTKYRIYISPFTQLNIDMHNRVPTTDARLLRRIVRDYKYRAHSAASTIALWPKVRAGEDKNIFPYNGKADVMFNSALAYELSVLKKYAMPLLGEVGEDMPEYSEALRMIEFLRFFETIEEDEYIPANSILREFIGGSIMA